jgi:hypothetical protein
MREPLISGRVWAIAPPDDQTMVAAGSNESLWIVDSQDAEVLARFKTPGAAYLPFALYAMGMERVAYALAADLDLPVPAVYLESFNGRVGCITLRAGGRNALPFSWALGRSVMHMDILNDSVWPLAVAFDVWIANVDRRDDNILLDPAPPEMRPIQASKCMSWLVDHEKSGLWWPMKIDPGAGLDVESLNDLDGDMTAEGNGFLTGFMPAQYRNSFANLNEVDRNPTIEIVREVGDDQIESAVSEVPTVYMSDNAKELTITFLVARRDRIDTLARDAFPLP